MRLGKALAIVLAVLACGPGAAEPTPASVIDGHEYRDAGLTAYVNRVGGRLLAAAGLRPGSWRFVVLDTPDPNAFVLPDREIVITRGMLALVNDEAELAVVLAHEIGHAVAGDGPDLRGAAARRAAEYEADRRGMTYVAAAGYDPSAQVDVLRSLLASRELEASLAGGNPRRAVRGHGDHPALPDRVRQATRGLAGLARAGDTGGVRDRRAYLAAIDGMVFGDGASQGFLSGASFIHPDLGFAFDPPPGYRLVNAPDVVVSEGPNAAMLLLDSVPDPGGDPAAYLARTWAPEIAQGIDAGRLADLRATKIGGLPAAQARLPLTSDGSRRTADLTVVRYGGGLYRLTGLYRPNDTAAAAALSRASASFRPLSRAAASRSAPLRIRIHRIAAGEDVAAMARTMPVPAASRATFDLLNGLGPGRVLRVGDAIKLVSE